MSISMKRLAARRGIRLGLAGLATLWCAGCSVPDSINPVNWYRDATGLSDDDPSEDTRNTGNLAAGNTRDYPNLATVPPTPTRALSTSEREALTQRLVSDRANAKYIDDQLRGGPSVAAAPPPRPATPAPSATASAAPAAAIPGAPVPAAPTPAGDASASLLGEPVSNAPAVAPARAAASASVPPPATVASASPAPSSPSPRPATQAPSATASAAPPAAVPGVPVPTPPTSVGDPSGSLLSEPASSAPAPLPATARAAASAGAPPPAAVASATPAPSPASPPPAPPAAPAETGRSAPWVSLTAPPPAAAEQQATVVPPTAAATTVDPALQPRESPLTSPTVRSMPEPETPRAAPPPPTLAQGGGQKAAAQGAGVGTQLAARTPANAPPAAASAAGAPVAQVTFADNSTRLSPSDRRIVGEVIPLQRQTGAAFRIVGYASRGGGNASQQLANFRIALDRANAVASVLAQAGIAADQILVETAPPTGESGVAANRAEIFLEN